MNQKGLTLIEMVATLIILSVIALIVTPNIYDNIREYKNQLFETQMNNVTEAAKSWATDNVKLLPSDSSYSLKVTVQELQSGGYLSDNLKNPRDGGKFDESTVFALINCNYIEENPGNYVSNYNYTYGSYEDIEDYEKKMAIKYVKGNSISTPKSIDVSELQTYGYMTNSIRDTSGNTIEIPDNVILVETEEIDNEMIYKASVE